VLGVRFDVGVPTLASPYSLGLNRTTTSVGAPERRFMEPSVGVTLVRVRVRVRVGVTLVRVRVRDRVGVTLVRVRVRVRVRAWGWGQG